MLVAPNADRLPAQRSARAAEPLERGAMAERRLLNFCGPNPTGRTTLAPPPPPSQQGRVGFEFRPQLGRGYPLNLSISISGGKETNKDSRSNGE